VLVLANVPANAQRLFSLSGLDAHPIIRPPRQIASSTVEERDPNRRASGP
jgi:hypothetical protein